MMELKKQITSIFSNLLGAEIEVESNGNSTIPYTDKDLFIKAVTNWHECWKTQNELFLKYGIDFSGYDTQLYNALENMILLKYGEVKYSIIVNYIYVENPSKDVLVVTDNKEQEYTIKTIEDLYDFISSMNDDDFIKK